MPNWLCVGAAVSRSAGVYIVVQFIMGKTRFERLLPSPLTCCDAEKIAVNPRDGKQNANARAQLIIGFLLPNTH